MKCFVSKCESDFHCYKYADEPKQAAFSIHRFPKDPQRRLAWINAISNAEKRSITMNTINFSVVRLCSKHFLDSDFCISHGRKKLKNTAIPSIFDSSKSISCVPSIDLTVQDCGFNEPTVSLPKVAAYHETDSPNVTPLEHLSCDDDVDPLQTSQSNILDFEYTYPNKERKETKLLSANPRSVEHIASLPLPRKRRRAFRYAGDVKADIQAEDALIVVHKIKKQLARSQKIVKQLRNQNYRLKNRIDSMQDLFNKLKEKYSISGLGHTISQDCSSNNSIFEELSSRTNGQPYSDALCSFATTLHSHSPRAYSYVRRIFNNTLPHPRTVFRWYEHINGEPGIKKETLDPLEPLEAAQTNSQGKQLSHDE